MYVLIILGLVKVAEWSLTVPEWSRLLQIPHFIGVRLGHTKNALVWVFTIEAYTTSMSSFFI